MQYDFEHELRGDDEGDMNVKDNGMVPAIIVGVILTAANIFIARTAAQGDNTVAAIAELKTTVAQLSKQLEKLTEQPYVRRDDYQSGYQSLQNGLSGLERRVDGLEGRLERGTGKR